MSVNVLDIKKYDVTNGPSTRLSIWLSGCCNNCPGCWAKHTWNPNQGIPLKTTLEAIKELVNNPHIKGVSLLGGDPLYNIMEASRRDQCWDEFMELLEICSVKPIWMWTGYTWDEIKAELTEKQRAQLFSHISYLIEGRFKIKERNLSLMYRGSANQRVLRISPDGLNYEDVTDDADSKKLCWDN